MSPWWKLGLLLGTVTHLAPCIRANGIGSRLQRYPWLWQGLQKDTAIYWACLEAGGRGPRPAASQRWTSLIPTSAHDSSPTPHFSTPSAWAGFSAALANRDWKIKDSYDLKTMLFPEGRLCSPIRLLHNFQKWRLKRIDHWDGDELFQLKALQRERNYALRLWDKIWWPLFQVMVLLSADGPDPGQTRARHHLDGWPQISLTYKSCSCPAACQKPMLENFNTPSSMTL